MVCTDCEFVPFGPEEGDDNITLGSGERQGPFNLMTPIVIYLREEQEFSVIWGVGYNSRITPNACIKL